jgi:hypothetical protein
MKKNENCAGTCEACECSTKENPNEIIKFYASHYAQTEKAFCCLAVKGLALGSYSYSAWFPFKIASFEKLTEGFATEIIVSAPLWFLKAQKIDNSITRVK